MEKNKTTKYVKYAIGEIVLVVIGILIALQINNWNELRKDRVQEQKMLSQLREEFKSNLRQIESKITIRANIMQKSAEVLDYMDSQQDMHKDTLIQKLSTILLTPTFDPIQNDLFNSERLQLIQNDTLRKYLSNWPSSVADLKEGENEMVMIYNTIIFPFFIEFGLARDANLMFYNDDKNLNYLLDKSLSRKINLNGSKHTPSVTEILNSRVLEGILSSTFLVSEGVNWEAIARRNQMIKIIELIEAEIK